jgi:HNH endonuclease
MKDIELVLRFSAFHHATYLNYKPPMKNFLNKEAETYRDITANDARSLRAAFKNTCQVIRSMFDKNAFKRFHRGTERNPAGYWEPKKFNASLYDIMMYSFAREDKNVLYQKLDSIREALICVMTENEEFIDAIELSTSSVQAVTKRFDIWRSTLQGIVGIAKSEPRCFSMQLKETLFKSNSTCAICGQKIASIDDSAVDHIKQYWTGGRTIPENARLAHRFCNCSRPRTD